MYYEVIQSFTDLQDFAHPYKVGETYPREGFTASEERLSELSGSQNRQHKPLIRLVVDAEAEEVKEKSETESESDVKYTKTEIMHMSKADLVSLATLFNIQDAEELSGAKLKEALIEYLAL